MRKEIGSVDRIINLSIQSLRQDNPNEYVNIETQTCNELSSYYINSAVGPNDGLSVMVALESTEIEAAFYQLVGLLRETSDLLKAEIKDKQAINNSIDTKNVTKNQIKRYGSCEQQAIKECNKGNDADIAS